MARLADERAAYEAHRELDGMLMRDGYNGRFVKRLRAMLL